MRLPDFLIVGAMKSGTTGLFRDLELNPDVFLPTRKEPEGFVDDAISTPEGLRRYADNFARAGDDQVTGEASTSYTKLPDVPGVAERAARVVPEAKIIYLVREPVSRVVSHHRHDVARGAMPADLDVALEQFPALIDYTRYSYQIGPWIDHYGDRVLVVRFEDYVQERRATVDRVSEFLQIPPRGDLVDESVVYNRSEDTRVAGPAFGRLTTSDLYRRRIQVLLPRRLRDRLRVMALPRRGDAPAAPSDRAIATIRGRLAADLARLPELVGDERLRW